MAPTLTPRIAFLVFPQRTVPAAAAAAAAAAAGERCGFFLGDGAGVGKGRQIAAITKEFWATGTWLRRPACAHSCAHVSYRPLVCVYVCA